MLTRRYSRTATAAAALCLLTAACGGEAREDRATTVDPPSSSAAVDPSSAPAPEVDDGVSLDQEQLQAALLTVQDLPTGYSAAPSEPDEEEDSTTTGADAECSAKFDALSSDEDAELAKAETSFEGGFGVVLEQSLESYEDGSELEERFAAVADVLSDCPTFTDTDADGTVTEFQVGALSFPNLGDRTLALAITGTTEDFTLKLNIAIVQLGNHAMYVAQGGLAADAAVLEQAGRAGATKLAAAIESA